MSDKEKIRIPGDHVKQVESARYEAGASGCSVPIDNVPPRAKFAIEHTSEQLMKESTDNGLREVAEYLKAMERRPPGEIDFPDAKFHVQLLMNNGELRQCISYRLNGDELEYFAAEFGNLIRRVMDNGRWNEHRWACRECIGPNADKEAEPLIGVVGKPVCARCHREFDKQSEGAFIRARYLR